MWFKCDCGNIINENKCCTKLKGYLLNEDDFTEYFNNMQSMIEECFEKDKSAQVLLDEIRELSKNLFRAVYQCDKCGNLYLIHKDGSSEVFNYVSMKDEISILKSPYREKCKRPIYALWDDVGEPKGYLSYYYGYNTYDDWNNLEEAYYRLYKDMKRKSVLKSACLKRNKEIVHQWKK